MKIPMSCPFCGSRGRMEVEPGRVERARCAVESCGQAWLVLATETGARRFIDVVDVPELVQAVQRGRAPKPLACRECGGEHAPPVDSGCRATTIAKDAASARFAGLEID